MKKFYLSIIAAAMAMVAVPAAAQDWDDWGDPEMPEEIDPWTITLRVDNPEAIEFVQWQYVDAEPTAEGVYTFTCNVEMGCLAAYAAEGYIISEAYQFMPGDDEPIDVSWYIRMGKDAFEAYPSLYDNGSEFYIVTQSMADLYDMTVTVNIDIPEAVEISTASWRDIHFTEQTTQISLSSMLDLPISVAPYWEYDGKIYRVQHNGEDVAASWGSYEIYPEDGDVIDITVTFPEADIPVTVTLLDPATADGVWFYTTYGENIAYDEPFIVHPGQTLYAGFDTEKYKVTSFVVNGEPVEIWYGSYELDILDQEAIAIEVGLEAYAQQPFTVTVDNAQAISVFNGYRTEGESMPLVDGLNHLLYTEGQYSSTITITANSGYIILAITELATSNDGTVETIDHSPYPGSTFSQIDVYPGIDLYVVTALKERDSKLVLYMDGTEMLNEQSFVYRADRKSVPLVDGYQVLDYSSIDELPFSVGLYTGMPSVYNLAFLNGELLEPEFEGGSNYTIPSQHLNYDTWEMEPDYNLNGLDVLKIYVEKDAPETIVLFEFEDFDDASLPKVLADIHVEMVAPDEGFIALPGTQLDVIPGETKIKSLSLNEIEIDPNEDGSYTFVAQVPNADIMPADLDEEGEDPEIDPGFGFDTPLLVVNVKGESNSGVANVAASRTDAPQGIYNLQGIRIRADRNSLPAGIYVINGAKVVVK